jgi:hypothetical protein
MSHGISLAVCGLAVCGLAVERVETADDELLIQARPISKTATCQSAFKRGSPRFLVHPEPSEREQAIEVDRVFASSVAAV